MTKQTSSSFKGFGLAPSAKSPKPPKISKQTQEVIDKYRSEIHQAFLERDSGAIDRLFEEYTPILGLETAKLRLYDVFFLVGNELQEWFNTVDLKNLPKRSK